MTDNNVKSYCNQDITKETNEATVNHTNWYVRNGVSNTASDKIQRDCHQESSFWWQTGKSWMERSIASNRVNINSVKLFKIYKKPKQNISHGDDKWWC